MIDFIPVNAATMCPLRHGGNRRKLWSYILHYSHLSCGIVLLYIMHPSLQIYIGHVNTVCIHTQRGVGGWVGAGKWCG